MSQHSDDTTKSTSPAALIAVAWLIVLIPLAYGLWQTLVKAGQLLGG